LGTDGYIWGAWRCDICTWGKGCLSILYKGTTEFWRKAGTAESKENEGLERKTENKKVVAKIGFWAIKIHFFHVLAFLIRLHTFSSVFPNGFTCETIGN
jgi:hypothetical protein